jgi:hypothetical protein
MKSKEEIEKITEKLYPVSPNPNQMIEGFERVAYKKGYMQSQGDMAEDLEMHILLNEHDWSRNPQVQLKDFINSLNKQD